MKMKAIGITSAVVLSMFLGVSALGHAGQEPQNQKQDHAKPEQNSHAQQPQQHQQARQEQSKPQQQHQQQARQPQAQQHAQPQQQAQQPQRQAQPQQHETQPQQARQQQNRPQQHDQAQPQQRQAQQRQQPNVQQAHGADRSPEQQRLQQSAWQQHRAGNWNSDHRTWAQRGGYNGYRIPNDRFDGYFGQSHGFRIGGLPFLVVGGYPRFQYGGYWFSVVDPYPGDWAGNWYDTDDVYVSYVDNGYYLFNRRHPGIGVAISISR